MAESPADGQMERGHPAASHLLIRMAQRLPADEYVAIKRGLVDICFDLLGPVCESVGCYGVEEAPYLTYILRK